MEEARKIVELCTPKAYAIAFRLTGNKSDAWDLVQNAMIKVLKSYASYDPAYKIEQWLYRILHNLYIDALRLQARRREDSLDLGPEEGKHSVAAALVDPAPRPEQEAERAQTCNAVQRALNTLPGELRMALALVDLEGYSYAEAAKILEIPSSTLGVHVFRARKLMREILSDLQED